MSFFIFLPLLIVCCCCRRRRHYYYHHHHYHRRGHRRHQYHVLFFVRIKHQTVHCMTTVLDLLIFTIHRSNGLVVKAFAACVGGNGVDHVWVVKAFATCVGGQGVGHTSVGGRGNRPWSGDTSHFNTGHSLR